jgi:hypothetical protein
MSEYAHELPRARELEACKLQEIAAIPFPDACIDTANVQTAHRSCFVRASIESGITYDKINHRFVGVLNV